MTISEMIDELVSIQGRHGDLPVVAGGIAEGEGINHVEFYEDDNGKVVVVE